MTPEAQRIAIAEACGFKAPFETSSHWWEDSESDGWEDVLKDGQGRRVPDYLSNLNAMFYAEERAMQDLMDADQWEEYGKWLERLHPTATILTNDKVDFYELANLAHATAAQRAEAFLRTVGKWVD